MRALLAVDLREMDAAKAVVSDAAAWAAKMRATLDLLYADELRQSSPEVADLGLADEYRDQWLQGQREDEAALDALLGLIPAENRGRIRALAGKSAVDAIVAEAEDNVDLVIVATHGRTGISSWLVGSVAESVVRTSPKPVLVLRIHA